MDLLFTRRVGESWKNDLSYNDLLVSPFSCKDDYCCSHPTLIQLFPLQEEEELCPSFAKSWFDASLTENSTFPWQNCEPSEGLWSRY